jgi:hypothetical protein
MIADLTVIHKKMKEHEMTNCNQLQYTKYYNQATPIMASYFTDYNL